MPTCVSRESLSPALKAHIEDLWSKESEAALHQWLKRCCRRPGGYSKTEMRGWKKIRFTWRRKTQMALDFWQRDLVKHRSNFSSVHTAWSVSYQSMAVVVAQLSADGPVSMFFNLLLIRKHDCLVESWELQLHTGRLLQITAPEPLTRSAISHCLITDY